MMRATGLVVEQVEVNTNPKPSGENVPESLIDQHSSFNGRYCSTHNLRIEGAADGEIECQSTLTIAKDAKVRAKVVAQNVTIGGSLEGEIMCPGRLQILPTGRVVGQVVAGTLEILAGAFYEGALSMHRPASQTPDGDGKKGAEIAARATRLATAITPTALASYDEHNLDRTHDGNRGEGADPQLVKDGRLILSES